MRVLSIILITHILLLTAVPALPKMLASPNNEQCESSCCSSDEAKQKQPVSGQNKDCCNKGMCNPFMICCNCCALAAQTQNFTAPFVYSDQKFDILSETTNSDFLTDAWHPPKIL